MTAQVPETTVVQTVRFNLPLQLAKTIVCRMIDGKQKRAFLDVPAHLRAQARRAAITTEEVAAHA